MMELLPLPREVAFSDLRASEKLLYGFIASRCGSLRYVQIPEHIAEICRFCGYTTAGDVTEAIQELRRRELADFREVVLESEEGSHEIMIALVPLEPSLR